MKEEEIRKREIHNKYIELSAKDVEVYFNDPSVFIDINCPACNARDSEISINKNNFDYHLCKNCETLYVNPRPPVKDLNKYYTESPSATYWVNEFFLPVAEARREKMFKPRAEYVANYFKTRETLHVGDIGAGFGIFLEELIKIKPEYKVTAIEPSNEMAEICRGKRLNVIPQAIEDVDHSKYSFDILTSFELFEHLFDPSAFLKTIYNLLNPGGYIILTTLNGLGFDIQINWEKSKSISPPHHLNFFNPWAVKLLMEKIGFNNIIIETPGVLDWDIVEGNYNKEEINPGRLWKTVSKYTNKKAKLELQKWITDNKMSSHMRIIAQKPIK